MVNASQTVGGARRGPYRLRRRATRMDETRQRITQAAVELHQEIGPLATTVTAIAHRAAVGRPTVYAHFPDEQTLFAACTAHYFGLHPAPDPMAWTQEPDQAIRLVRGLTELYGYWAEIEPMAARVLRDYRVAPDRVGQGFVDFMGLCRDALTEDWPVTGNAQSRLRAVVGHAVRFETWQSLVRDGGLSTNEGATIMTGAVRAAIALPPTRARSRTLASRSGGDTR